MESKELQALIATFKEYRDLITPIEHNLRAFSISFDGLKEDINKLSGSFDGEVKTKLDNIYQELSTQATKAQSLSAELDKFLTSTNQYVSRVDNLVQTCGLLTEKLKTVDAIEKKAEMQIAQLDAIIEEKKKSYDIKQLERNLAQYNVGVEKISQYIDTSVAEALKNSGDKITAIQDKNNRIYQTITKEHESLEQVLKNFSTTNTLLRQFLENATVNETYLFDILDNWAEDRKLKIKR